MDLERCTGFHPGEIKGGLILKTDGDDGWVVLKRDQQQNVVSEEEEDAHLLVVNAYNEEVSDDIAADIYISKM